MSHPTIHQRALSVSMGPQAAPNPIALRALALLRDAEATSATIEPRFLVQRSHLTAPAPLWKYVESAVKSDADLVMLDLEDSIPRGDDAALAAGRANVVRALTTLEWGWSLRFFRPRGLALDPSFEDVRAVVSGAKDKLQGLIWPKAEGAAEVRLLDEALAEAEAAAGLSEGQTAIGVLIESARAEEEAFAIAAASRRIRCLIFGAYDYFSSLGLPGVAYRFDHPLADAARMRITKAAASAGVPAVAEMTVNFPVRSKSAAEQAAALDECRRDAEHARLLGFRGKWVGIPAQVAVAHRVFALPEAEIARALAAARAFRQAEREGRGALILDGKMADRATDRQNRVLLDAALAMGLLDAGALEGL